jgi:hypothetical protein
VIFILSLIPLALGYLLVNRVLGEREGHLCIPLSYALGLSCFLFGVNGFFHVLTLRGAVLATLGLMALAAVVLWPLKARRPVWLRLGRLEAALLIALTLTAFFRALFWQMKHSDDDFWAHASLMALYLRDSYPPRNPFYPDQPYLGHYGRDLSLSALSVLWGERFFAVQYVVTALNHSMTVLLAYFASRRFLRSTRQALLAVILAFVGLNPFRHRSLLDVFTNNNTFVHLLLFLNAYLFLLALRRPRVGTAMLSALCLATYSIVYTTHHGVLLVAFPLLAAALIMRSRHGRALRAVTAAAILIGSLGISLVHGGTLSDVGHRYLFSAKPRVDAPREEAFLNQQVDIQFPKGRIGFTAFDGTPYSLFSLRFLEETGLAVAFLPATLVILFCTRRYWALLLALIAVVAVITPATVRFGLYENDTYRFLFLGGLGSAMALGAVLGMGLDRLASNHGVPPWARAMLAIFLVFTCFGSVVGTVTAFADVARRPELYPWSAAEWACNGIHRDACDPLDVRAAIAMRPMIRAGESILTNIHDDHDREFIAHGVISAFARAFVSGHGIRVVRDSAAATGRDIREQAGYRAIAFWSTGATGLLDDLHVDWLLVDPSRLTNHVRDALAHSPRLRLVHREEDAARGAVREVYRVEHPKHVETPPLTAAVTVVAVEFPSQMGRAWFAEIPFAVTVRDPAFSGKMRIGTRVSAGAQIVNAGDRVAGVVELAPAGLGRWSGKFPFVSPFEPGEYDVEITAGPAETPLPGPDGNPVRLKLKVM